ncbi:MAG: cysteine--tRNA ligase [Christensenellaceae bacterium]|jgi:cysteinyl-tRNA synthetase|nr:cysteine--tRNA ligase [Christensenellaceae bacterium]
MFIYNTLSRRKEELRPQTPGKVGIYACGPTVYNYIHIGNARPVVVFDTLRRYLIWRGHEVKFVQNFTDIDDKMINRANEEGGTVRDLAERFIAAYEQDTRDLNVLEESTIHPRATEHIPEIISLIEALIDKDLAYLSDDGVYYNTKAFAGYGKLSGQNIDDLESGARVEIDESKRSPMDFALWKNKKPGEPFWPSPFGEGRPGWHIECSAMSMKYLGESFDIHCGGQDLIFPHHENELAQSEGATGKPFARFWMHNGFININNEKMSKSKGNFFTLREIGEQYDLEAVRFFMLSSHYRSPINFSEEQMEQAKSALRRLYEAQGNYAFLLERGGAKEREPNQGEQAFLSELQSIKARFIEFMDDDLNTAGALGAMFDLVSSGNRIASEGVSAKALRAALDLLTELSSVLGLLYRAKGGAEDEGVDALVAQREAARKAKNWAEADRLRDEIKALGYILEDTQQGAKVKKQ